MKVEFDVNKKGEMKMNTEMETILECLVDEVRASGDPSEKTLLILAKYEDEYDFIKDYFKELDENDEN